ncbi:MAG: deoxyribonuclease IV [Chloroflexota bacterium]|nr:deoxyribonuclease IV [Chloroflexota bacterium]
MTLAFGAHMSASGGCDLAITRAEEFGMSSCQLFSKNERQWRAKPLDPDVIDRFHKERERTGIDKLVVHDSYLINLASPKEDILAKSLDAFKDELERCQLLGIPYLVTHPGAHTGSGVEAGIHQFATSLNRIHDELPDNETMTLLETTAGQGTTLGRSFAELAAIIEQVEDKARVGICLDTCHVFAAGYDYRDRDGYEAMIAQFDEVLGLDRLRVVHLNDSKFPLASNKDRHEHIGEGEIGPEGFRWLVNDPRLDGIPGILETEKGDDGEFDRKNLGTLRALVDNTE